MSVRVRRKQFLPQLQLINEENFIKRMLYYVTRLYSDQMKRRVEYIEAKRVVLVAIVDFEIEELIVKK